MQNLRLNLPDRDLAFLTVDSFDLIRSIPKKEKKLHKVSGDFSFHSYINNLYLPLSPTYFNSLCHRLYNHHPIVKSLRANLLAPVSSMEETTTYYLKLDGTEDEDKVLNLILKLQEKEYLCDYENAVVFIHNNTIPHTFKLYNHSISMLVSTPFISVHDSIPSIEFNNPKDNAFVTVLDKVNNNLLALERKMTINKLISLLEDRGVAHYLLNTDFYSNQYFRNDIDYLERQFEANSIIKSVDQAQPSTITFSKVALTPSCGKVCIEFPCNRHTISDNTAYNRMLNCIDNYKVSSFTQLLDATLKTQSVIDRLNNLYKECLPHIKTNLDSIGLTQKILTDLNGIPQTYPFHDVTSSNYQESYHLYTHNIPRVYSETNIKAVRKTEPKDYLLNNQFAVLQKALLKLPLPPINPKHKDKKYAKFVKDLLTLQMYSYYFYDLTSPSYELSYPKGKKDSICVFGSIITNNIMETHENIKFQTYFMRFPSDVIPAIANMVSDQEKAEFVFDHITKQPKTPAAPTAPPETRITITTENVTDKIKEIVTNTSANPEKIQQFLDSLKSTLNQ